jgi:large conductance mechanosensitive channel
MGMIREFRDFAIRGNVIDLAIAVVIGAAFAKIITSLVDDIIMPLIGKLIGDPNYFLTMQAGGIPVGRFIQAIFNFLIVAFILFLIIRAINSMKKKDSVTAPAAPAEDIILLREIRDALRR